MLYKEYDRETLEKLQKIELEILKDFDDLCRKHGLTYFGCGGTAIGAVRHHGCEDGTGYVGGYDDVEHLAFEHLVHVMAGLLEDRGVGQDACKVYVAAPFLLLYLYSILDGGHEITLPRW
jgi:hypothetical protein